MLGSKIENLVSLLLRMITALFDLLSPPQGKKNPSFYWLVEMTTCLKFIVEWTEWSKSFSLKKTFQGHNLFFIGFGTLNVSWRFMLNNTDHCANPSCLTCRKHLHPYLKSSFFQIFGTYIVYISIKLTAGMCIASHTRLLCKCMFSKGALANKPMHSHIAV